MHHNTAATSACHAHQSPLHVFAHDNQSRADRVLYHQSPRFYVLVKGILQPKNLTRVDKEVRDHARCMSSARRCLLFRMLGSGTSTGRCQCGELEKRDIIEQTSTDCIWDIVCKWHALRRCDDCHRRGPHVYHTMITHGSEVERRRKKSKEKNVDAFPRCTRHERIFAVHI